MTKWMKVKLFFVALWIGIIDGIPGMIKSRSFNLGSWWGTNIHCAKEALGYEFNDFEKFIDWVRSQEKENEKH